MPFGKENVEFVCAFRGSFIATNNPSGFNCFYLNKNNYKMWLLDNLYPQCKEIKKHLSKFDDSKWSKKYYLKVDKFLLERCFMCQFFKQIGN